MKSIKSVFCIFLLLLSSAFFSACGNQELTVVDQNGKSVRVSAAADGSYAFKVPSGEQQLTIEEWKNPFIDVSKSAWFFDAVRYCYESGIMHGTSETTFSPNLATSRSMIVATLWRMEGSPHIGQNPFSDVTADMYYADAVAWAASHGIVDGYSETIFGPEDPITREQLASILYRYADFQSYDTKERASLASFADADTASAYAEDALSWAAAHEIINGTSEGLLIPRGEATRAQVATILMGWCQNFSE